MLGKHRTQSSSLGRVSSCDPRSKGRVAVNLLRRTVMWLACRNEHDDARLTPSSLSPAEPLLSDRGPRSGGTFVPSGQRRSRSDNGLTDRQQGRPAPTANKGGNHRTQGDHSVRTKDRNRQSSLVGVSVTVVYRSRRHLLAGLGAGDSGPRGNPFNACVRDPWKT